MRLMGDRSELITSFATPVDGEGLMVVSGYSQTDCCVGSSSRRF